MRCSTRPTPSARPIGTLQTQVEELRQERDELRRQQQVLRQAIELEANANNMEWVDDETGGDGDGLAPSA